MPLDKEDQHPIETLEALHNLQAEQALLGALLLNNSLLEHVQDYLRPEHFGDALHGRVYLAICTLSDRGRVADPLTLRDYFERDEVLESVGGAKYLLDLVESVISTVSVRDYGKMIYELYLRRQLVGIGQDVMMKASQISFEEGVYDQIEHAERQLYDLAQTGDKRATSVPFSEALAQAIKSAEAAFKRDSHVVGVTTGLHDLDRSLGGLHPSDLLIIAGRPSMGKTALAMNIAFNAASAYTKNPRDGAKVLFFSLEMSSEQLAGRILASETQISSDRIRRGDIRSEDFETFVEVSRRMGSTPLIIDDTPSLTISGIRNRARRIQRQQGIGLIVIDYLQLLDGGTRKSGDNRVNEISEITRGLKGIAKELHVPILALSQLSRAVEQRDDKRPQLSDLRESGSIEQDADVVMFIFREEYYEERRQPPPGTDKHLEWCKRMEEIHNKAEVIIAKQRHGPIGTIRLFFDGRFTRFGNLVHSGVGG